jgi:hypothetical protein
MKFSIHEKAISNFNNRGSQLVTNIKEFTQQAPVSKENTFRPEIHTKVVSPISIGKGPIPFTTQGGSDRSQGLLFGHEGREFGLAGSDYEEFNRLVDSIYRQKEIQESISMRFLQTAVFEWIKRSYTGAEQLPLMNCVLQECENSLQQNEFWFPVAQTHIEGELIIGDVIIQTITKTMFDNWDAEIKQQPEGKARLSNEDLEEINRLLNRKRHEMQGFAAATITVYAESGKAFEIAYDKARQAVNILRVFSPAMLHPLLISHCALLGSENVQAYKYIKPTKNGVSFSEGFLSNEWHDWKIDNKYIAIMKQNGLEVVSDLLKQKQKSNFAEAVLDALVLYSKSCLMHELADRLVYMLVPLESLLLRDQNEPIMQNISERMALFLGSDITMREEIIRTVKEVYAIRSKFIHHGESVKEEEILRKFMIYTASFFWSLTHSISQFSEKGDFIKAIERMKLSGGLR